MRLPSFLHWLRFSFHGLASVQKGGYPDPQLKDLILFVTERCNLRCRHCLFWQRIDSPGKELSLEQIQKIAGSVPALRTMVLTGGEPFLRKDLPQIAESFYRINHARHVQIDSNGLLIEPMISLLEQNLAKTYQSHLTYQISLDGLEENHDRLRQSPGSFKKTVENLKQLVSIKKDFPYFRLVVLSNIHSQNYEDIEPLSRLLSEEIGVEHAFDIVRGSHYSSWGIPENIRVEEDPRDCALPPKEQLRPIIETIKKIDENEGGIHREFVRQLEYQTDMYLGKPVPFPCVTAGRTIGTVYSDGSVAACEFTKPFANLADFDYDLGTLWCSECAGEQRKQITRCRCCHSCFVLTSMQEWEAR